MMKWVLAFLALPCAAWAAVSSPQEQAAPDGQKASVRNPVALVKAGPVEDAILERVKNWAESQLAIPVPVAESLETHAESLDAVAAEASARLTPDDLGVIVLLSSEHALPNHGIFNPDLRVVVVNVNRMREGADDETYGRRMERQVIRGIGSLMGLELSPNPESAMASYSTMEELDQMGRNLDPPWLYKLQQRARELGISLDPDNPYNLLRE